MPYRLPAFAAAVVTVTLAARAVGQEPAATVPCEGQTISDISVTTRPPIEDRSDRWWEFPLRVAASVHVVTEPNVVRRYLIPKLGRPCVERERAESERILRAQPFIADASVRVVADSAGTVALVVETRDELTPVVGVSGSGGRISGLKLGDGNFLGSGTYLAGEWRHGEVRDQFGGRAVDYQFLGRPYVFQLSGARRDLGLNEWSVDMSHPFFTDQQRIAWRVSGGSRRDRFGFLRPEADPVPLGFLRQFASVGAIVRIGFPGRLSLFGVSFSHETDAPRLPMLPDPAAPYDSLFARYPDRRNARVNALWGLRNLHFLRVERFDGLNAIQDLRLGFQLGTLFGRSLSVIGTTDDDYLLAADVYAGVGSSGTLVALSARGEGRQNYDTNQWDGILGAGNLTVIRRLMAVQTFTARVDWSGGWRQRVPFQLALGHWPGGVRGYQRSQDGGARRAVVRIEDRWYLGHAMRQVDVGIAGFADAGRVWKGDAPYGVDSPWKYSAGLSLLAAVPPRSKRTWRLDLAFPISPDRRARWGVRLSSAVAGRDWREPGDVSWSRERSVPTSVFAWP